MDKKLTDEQLNKVAGGTIQDEQYNSQTCHENSGYDIDGEWKIGVSSDPAKEDK